MRRTRRAIRSAGGSVDLFVISLVVTLGSVSPTAWAWDHPGHMTTATIDCEFPAWGWRGGILNESDAPLPPSSIIRAGAPGTKSAPIW